MLREEFTKHTGIYPSEDLYRQIEAAYLETDLDQKTFCSEYKRNKNGIAEKIARKADLDLDSRFRLIAETAESLKKDVADLTKKLDAEQEWKPYCLSSITQEEYADIRKTVPHIFDEAKARDMLYNWFGFANSKVTILYEIPKCEVNRHRVVRTVGKLDRSPVYSATDLNYIRFNCGLQKYELVNGELLFFNE